MPRLYSVPVVPFISLQTEASTVVIFVSLSKEKKIAELRRYQSFTILISPVGRYVERVSTKAIWWEKKKIKSWSKLKGCFLQRRSWDFSERTPQKEILMVAWSCFLTIEGMTAEIQIFPQSLHVCVQLAQFRVGQEGIKEGRKNNSEWIINPFIMYHHMFCLLCSSTFNIHFL